MIAFLKSSADCNRQQSPLGPESLKNCSVTMVLLLPLLLLSHGIPSLSCHGHDPLAVSKSSKTASLSDHQLAKFDPVPFMREAIRQAEEAAGAPFGAVIVNISGPEAKLVASGANNATINPVLHAEISTINELALQLQKSKTSVSPIDTTTSLSDSSYMCRSQASALIWFSSLQPNHVRCV